MRASSYSVLNFDQFLATIFFSLFNHNIFTFLCSFFKKMVKNCQNVKPVGFDHLSPTPS